MKTYEYILFTTAQQQETLIVFGIAKRSPVGEIRKFLAREDTVMNILLWKEGVIV